MEAMLSLGRSKGAKNAYLQVMLDNTKAYKLYQSLGFKELYQYWYRVRKL
jgi:ribosomal protein S18 acetylase RimI-like enzyme